MESLDNMSIFLFREIGNYRWVLFGLAAIVITWSLLIIFKKEGRDSNVFSTMLISGMIIFTAISCIMLTNPLCRLDLMIVGSGIVMGILTFFFSERDWIIGLLFGWMWGVPGLSWIFLGLGLSISVIWSTVFSISFLVPSLLRWATKRRKK